MDSEDIRQGQEIQELLRQHSNIRETLGQLAAARTNFCTNHPSDAEQFRDASWEHYKHAGQTFKPINDWVIKIERCYNRVRSKFPERLSNAALAAFNIWTISDSGIDPNEVADMSERAKNCLNFLVTTVGLVTNDTSDQNAAVPGADVGENLIKAPVNLEGVKPVLGAITQEDDRAEQFQRALEAFEILTAASRHKRRLRPRDKSPKNEFPKNDELIRRVYQLFKERRTHWQICEALDAEHRAIPEGVHWLDHCEEKPKRPWTSAYTDEKSGGAVRTWLSKTLHRAERDSRFKPYPSLAQPIAPAAQGPTPHSQL
ncbi:MAG TPA: hypothetical protein VNV82_12030 [Bryobacteraceae bacterium]|jgi:hypothetical protein|nr:hypothetical protein [Bryobacteraceae bacterium]